MNILTWRKRPIGINDIIPIQRKKTFKEVLNKVFFF